MMIIENQYKAAWLCSSTSQKTVI